MSEHTQKIADCQDQLKSLVASVQSVANVVGRGPGGREISLVITNLQQSGHWLRDAKAILEQSEQNPSN